MAAKRRAKATTKEPKRAKGRGGIFYLALNAAIVSGLAMAALLVVYARDLPDVSTLWSLDANRRIVLYDKEGQKIAERGTASGLPVALGDVPPYLPEAVIAVEDRRFYGHFGVDPIGIVRALIANMEAGRVVQGASTITQQLARNLFLTHDRTIKRKIQEVLLALHLEQRFTKDQILSLYLNKVYLGAGAYGVEAASQRYFNKSAARVTLYEAALLAGLLKAPSRYSPTNDPSAANHRAQTVLWTMQRAGFISSEQQLSARDEAHDFQTSTASSVDSVNYFTDWVVAQLGDIAGDSTSDLHVYTTLDSDLQQVSETALRRSVIRDGAAFYFSEAALVSLTPDGAVRAMVGGYDYRKSQFNRTTQAQRQPGSAFKPFVYAAALEHGMGPATEVDDEPVRVGNWEPKNYGDEYYGRVELQSALARSLNAATVRVGRKVGLPAIKETARRMGIASAFSNNLSLVLGSSEVTLLELTSAYVPFANTGYHSSPYGISRIETASGEILFSNMRENMTPALSQKHVAQMNTMMSQVLTYGTGKKAFLEFADAAGKTGTSQSSKDAWFIGYTSGIVTGVWIGNDNASPMRETSTGGTVAAVLWKDVMLEATRRYPGSELLKSGAETARDRRNNGGGIAGLLSRIWGGGNELDAEVYQ